MIKNRKNKKGFTLIELLVVIAIIAVLAVVVVLTLNPAELLKQARDSNRLSDFATMKSALSLYATDVATTTPLYATSTGGTDNLHTANAGAPGALSNYDTASSTWWGFSATAGYSALVTSTSRAVDGTGWIPVNFNAVSSGAPISSLPVDPVNSGSNMYIYGASSTVFKLATKMESLKYSTGGSADVETNDGGNSTSTYEAGTSLNAL